MRTAAAAAGGAPRCAAASALFAPARRQPSAHHAHAASASRRPSAGRYTSTSLRLKPIAAAASLSFSCAHARTPPAAAAPPPPPPLPPPQPPPPSAAVDSSPHLKPPPPHIRVTLPERPSSPPRLDGTRATKQMRADPQCVLMVRRSPSARVARVTRGAHPLPPLSILYKAPKWLVLSPHLPSYSEL